MSIPSFLLQKIYAEERTRKSVLSVAIVVAYVPQINRVFRLESCRGLSPYFVLFHGLFSNAQLAQTLLYSAFTYTNDREPVLEIIGDGRLKGTAALGGVFGLIQVAIQWTCAITLYVSAQNNLKDVS